MFIKIPKPIKNDRDLEDTRDEEYYDTDWYERKQEIELDKADYEYEKSREED